MARVFRFSAPFLSLLPAVAAVLLLAACGREQPKRQPSAEGMLPQGVPMPAQPQPKARPVSPQFLEAMKGVDISGLSDIEKEIFERTVRIQVPFYERLAVWADSADRIMDGEQAAGALRAYLRLNDQFATAMKTIDTELAGRVPPDFAGSPAFDKAVDEYLQRADMARITERITRSYSSLMVRFREHPACRSVIAQIDRLARSAP